MAERIVDVRQIDEQCGPYHVTGTVTRVYDQDAIERVKQLLVSWGLEKLPAILAEHRRNRESATQE